MHAGDTDNILHMQIFTIFFIYRIEFVDSRIKMSVFPEKWPVSPLLCLKFEKMGGIFWPTMFKRKKRSRYILTYCV